MALSSLLPFVTKRKLDQYLEGYDSLFDTIDAADEIIIKLAAKFWETNPNEAGPFIRAIDPELLFYVRGQVVGTDEHALSTWEGEGGAITND